MREQEHGRDGPGGGRVIARERRVGAPIERVEFLQEATIHIDPPSAPARPIRGP